MWLGSKLRLVEPVPMPLAPPFVLCGRYSLRHATVGLLRPACIRQHHCLNAGDNAVLVPAPGCLLTFSPTQCRLRPQFALAILGAPSVPPTSPCPRCAFAIDPPCEPLLCETRFVFCPRT